MKDGKPRVKRRKEILGKGLAEFKFLNVYCLLLEETGRNKNTWDKICSRQFPLAENIN